MPFRSFGPLEIGLVVLVILIFFGVGKLPQVGGAIGKGLRAFRKGQHGEDEEDEAVEKKQIAKRKTTKKLAKSGTKE
jgi:sec-independent protein translocase protein TatA